MTIKKILLTGDDGYHSLGTRLLIHFLKKKYDLTVFGTTSQQSGVGGKVSLKEGFNWAESEVDGVVAYWVDGTPSDAVELAATMYKEKKFDMAISGINWGANLGTAVIHSGTVSAALTVVGRNLSDYVLSLSWDLPIDFYLDHHEKEATLDEFLVYPGKRVYEIIEKVIENEFWGAQLLNINFPYKQAKKAVITQFTPNVKDLYDYDVYDLEGMKKGHIDYMKAGRQYKKILQDTYDAKAITNGYISITPMKLTLQDKEVFERNKFVSFVC